MDPAGEVPVATGMASLVHGDGLVVTCAHVILALGAIPGTVVTLYGAAPNVPIRVQAEVLAFGWDGPDWREADIALRPLAPHAFGADVAFLRIVPGSATWDPQRVAVPQGDPEQALVERTRVLRLGSPGYRHASHAPLLTWHVAWVADTPDMRSTDAVFLAVEPQLLGVIRFKGEHVRPGYSGSPLWDVGRQRMVGMVRRGIKGTVPDNVLGVDARVLSRLSGVPLHPDVLAARLLQVLARMAEYSAPLRHFPLLSALFTPGHIPLKAVPTKGQDILTERPTEQVHAADAKNLLISACSGSPVVVISGSAGSGKSTLLHEIAEDLLEHRTLLHGRRLVPLPIRAIDFERSGFDLRALLEQQVQKFTFDRGPGSILDAFDLNDLVPLLLLDGLDEIDRFARGHVISRLAAASSQVHVGARVLLASRPIDDIRIKDGRTLQGWPVFNLLHLSQEDVAALASLWYPSEYKRLAFMDLLKTVSWDRNGPTPLQIAAAASLSNSPIGFPDRPVDLPFRLVDHLVEMGRQEANSQIAAGTLERTRRQTRFADGIRIVLRRLGKLTLEGVTRKKEVIEALSEAGGELFEDPLELIEFLRRETQLTGGVLAFDYLAGSDWTLRWPHRTFAEALAAEDIAEATAFRPFDTLAAVQRQLRAQGQALVLTLLAALDGSSQGVSAVELVLTRMLDEGALDYNSTLLAVRALGAGIRTSPKLRARLVRTLIALLLLPDGGRLGPSKCIDLFTSDDLPKPLEIAQRPAIRPFIVEQLNERFRARAPARRDLPGPLYVSEREALLLDRLAMWSDISIHIGRTGRKPQERRSRPNPMPEALPTDSSDIQRGGFDGPGVSAALLAHALARLRNDSEGFLSGFAEFVRGQGAVLDNTTVGRMYIASLMADLNFDVPMMDEWTPPIVNRN